MDQNSLYTLESVFSSRSIFIKGLYSSPKITGTPTQAETGQDRNMKTGRMEKWFLELETAYHNLAAQKRAV